MHQKSLRDDWMAKITTQPKVGPGAYDPKAKSSPAKFASFTRDGIYKKGLNKKNSGSIKNNFEFDEESDQDENESHYATPGPG